MLLVPEILGHIEISSILSAAYAATFFPMCLEMSFTFPVFAMGRHIKVRGINMKKRSFKVEPPSMPGQPFK